jgi:peptide chain release factor 3
MHITTPNDTARTRDEFLEEVLRRRTFAIISHPDAGKTTLTEKLLLYGGAIHLAGSVKARRADRHAASDWMQLEQERGISVSSSVMQFEYDGYRINLLDTPGHEDFSEDTYRTLIAADSAVMLLDNRRGVEERTRQLFAVCKRRRTPIFTFVNKCDRPGADPLTLLSDVEADLGIACHAATWPIHRDGKFLGVLDRRRNRVHLFERGVDRGSKRARATDLALGDDELRVELGPEVHDRLLHDVALLDAAGHPFSRDDVLAGTLTPVYFGSALTNFGVETFLHEFLDLAPAPLPRESTTGRIEPTDERFTGFVFKIQANMDPRHRDRVAFVRICSGQFEAGMDVLHVRTGKRLRLTAPQQFLARERVHVERAWPGDVVGILDRGALRIGDSMASSGTPEFRDIPRFPPEHFARVMLADPMRRKQLDAGLRQLTEEGAAQVFFTSATDISGPTPIVGAVGLLQFDVLLHRLEHEYRVRCRLDSITYRYPRWVTGRESDIDRIASDQGVMRLYDAKGNPVLLFESEWRLRWITERDSPLTFHDVAP